MPQATIPQVAAAPTANSNIVAYVQCNQQQQQQLPVQITGKPPIQKKGKTDTCALVLACVSLFASNYWSFVVNNSSQC